MDRLHAIQERAPHFIQENSQMKTESVLIMFLANTWLRVNHIVFINSYKKLHNAILKPTPFCAYPSHLPVVNSSSPTATRRYPHSEDHHNKMKSDHRKADPVHGQIPHEAIAIWTNIQDDASFVEVWYLQDEQKSTLLMTSHEVTG